jgi:hypothetical protein
MSAELLISLALSFAPSWCTAPITTVPEIRDGSLALYYYQEHRIELSQQLFAREVQHAVIHECMHHAENKYDIDIPDYFGEPPFASEYAATDKWEDFAETLALEYQGQRVGGKKGAFARGWLRRLAREESKE